MESIDQLGFVSTVKYDAAGNTIEARDPNDTGYNMVYDELNRSTSQTDMIGSQTQSGYDKAGQQVQQVDAKGNSTTQQFDARARRILTTNRINGTVQFAYDAAGNQVSITDAEFQVTQYEYDDRSLKVKTIYPDHIPNSVVGTNGYGSTECSYDAVNRRQICTDQAGDTQTFNYDLAGRLLSRDYRTAVNSPAGPIADRDTFTYDAASRMLTATSGRYSNSCGMTYDDAGRKVSESLTVSGQTYTTICGYDDASRKTQMIYPDGTVLNRSYTDRNQLHQLNWDGTVVDTRTYDDGLRLITCALGNGITDSRTYNSDSTLASISSSNADIGSYSYTWDENKNKTAETITGPLAAYSFTTGATGYDNEDRLTNYTQGTLDQQWNLSLEGDWNTFTENGTVQTRTHGPTHEISTVGPTPITHDVKGNVTSKPSSLNSAQTSLLTWDFDNRLITVDTNGDATVDATHTYDAIGRRVTKNNTVYACYGQQVLAEYTTGTATASPTESYVYGTYIDEPVIKDGTSGITYYHRNHQHDVIALTDFSGTVVERYGYGPHGGVEVLSPTGLALPGSSYSNPYTYTGRRYEAQCGLYFFRARFYDSSLGRFLGRDPLCYVDGNSLYQAYFVFGRVDPMGTKYYDPNKTNPIFNPYTSHPYPELEAPEDPEAIWAIDALEWALSQGCLAQCIVLGMTNQKIDALLEEILNDLPNATRRLILNWMKSKASTSLLGLVGLAKGLQKSIAGHPQGTTTLGKLSKLHKIRLLRQLQKRIAIASRRAVGKAGSKIFTKVGSKFIPIVGKALLAKEAHDCAFCGWACKDGQYTSGDTYFEFLKWNLLNFDPGPGGKF